MDRWNAPSYRWYCFKFWLVQIIFKSTYKTNKNLNKIIFQSYDGDGNYNTNELYRPGLWDYKVGKRILKKKIFKRENK